MFLKRRSVWLLSLESATERATTPRYTYTPASRVRLVSKPQNHAATVVIYIYCGIKSHLSLTNACLVLGQGGESSIEEEPASVSGQPLIKRHVHTILFKKLTAEIVLLARLLAAINVISGECLSGE